MRSESESERNMYWQYIRGLCIILVVLIHSKTGISYQNGPYLWNFDYWLYMRQFINFPVAFFMFLSGFFTKIEECGVSTSYIVQRSKRLLIPFFMWSLFYSTIDLLINNDNYNVLKGIIKLFLGMSSTQLYFILVLVQLTLLSPFLVRTIQENKYTKILFLITPIYLLFVYGYVFLFGKQFVLTQTFFPAWLIFYYYGLWVKIKGNPHLLRRKIALKYTLFLVIALGISILESQLIKNNGYPIGFAASQIKFSSFIYAFMVINLIFIGRDIDINKEFKALRVLGDESYGIYYVHMIWIYIISKAIDSIPIPMVFNILPLYQIIQAGLTLLFSYFSIQITKVLLGKRIANKAVGF